MRNIININDNWKFVKEDIKEAYIKDINLSTWENISIPHTWNAIDGIDGGNDFYKGACWYRKEIFINKEYENKKIYIELNGSNSITNVYLNEKHLGEHKGGYSTFRFDISDVVEYGKVNTIAIKVDNSIVDDVYPIWADFTFYGGIYRDVNLVVTDKTHFELMNEGSLGVYVSQDNITKESASITVKSIIKNDCEKEEAIKLWIDVLDKEGNIVKYNAKDILLNPNESREISLPINIENPILWHGVKNPYLYNVKAYIMKDNDVLDELIIPTGFRYYRFDAKEGFFLNGEHMKLNGVSRHQDRKDKGWALSKKDHEEDMKLIKEVGANSIRLAHYQHDQYFYDLCDREGMIIWAEIPFISVMSKTDLKGENAKSQLVELIRQNYNHSSIVMWGVQNEIQIGGITDELRTLVKELHQLAKKEDSTRLTTQAQVMMVENEDEFHNYTDIMAYNKYYGWYQGEVEEFAQWLDDFNKVNPDTCIGISEYGAEGIIKYHTDNPQVKDYTEEYHALYHEKVMKIFNERKFVWGTYVWNFFDFGSDFRDEGGVKGRNNKGLITFDRKVKKDAFYMYKSLWSDEKFIHINSKRYIDRENKFINVKVYSNLNELTLFVNNEEVATLNSNHIFNFENIELVDGQNEVKVVAKSEGKVYTDFAIFNKVDERNSIYDCPEDKGGVVTNWFNDDKNKFDDVEIKELNITDDVYSTKCKFKELMANEETKSIIEKYFGQMLEGPTAGMLEGMTIDQLAELAGGQVSDKFIYVLNSELVNIKK
ncbi:glycoside hydrolase family 2 protein [Romboutsia hominis]|uniref:Beta-galactosidase n=1 Tax=Romboutsia hominis TaxID=1507512 RepID=A0A2P2BSE0_9FIRM|nr:glycoside hydrolase family 2 TIM barrel-domain containing protein [Romboutsia hominis]CEI73305.1 Beta-galactosidase [Romboutsia hominis]